MSRIHKYIALLLLTASILFNLWLYRLEPTAMVDPNDNAFQYGLIDRTNEIWNYADKTCPSFFVSRITCHVSLLTDHWVPNWAEGYNLPYYYSHIPQILIVGSYKFVSSVMCQVTRIFPFMTHDARLPAGTACSMTLFSYYHFLIYILLCFFPLSIFVALRILKLPWLTAGIGALLASHISTDGLYGLDQSSYLWRGWGLSSQLFAALWLPLALAYSIRFLCSEVSEIICADRFPSLFTHLLNVNYTSIKQKINRLKEYPASSGANKLFCEHQRDYLLAILFITATTAGHLGIGMMLFLALPVIAFTPVLFMIFTQQPWKHSIAATWQSIIKTILLTLPPLIILSYWIVPAMRDSLYHNVSFWDPVWKFNSFGVVEVITNLVNGALFDFGRLPLFTGLVLVGLFACFFYQEVSSILYQASRNKKETVESYSIQNTQYFILPILFFFYISLFFGRTTWGGLFDLIPGMNEFHGHRFIVGVHLIGLFLAPIGIMWLIKQLEKFIKLIRAPSPLLQYIYVSISIIFLTLITIVLYRQTIVYSNHNDTLIKQANINFQKIKPDVDELITTLKVQIQKDPGRVFAGRGGGWGKQFQVAETAMFMYLSTYGIPTVLWLPETWSLNSDIEQYFVEDNPSHYDLFGIKYIVAPPSQQPLSFWEIIKETPTWKLYVVSISDDVIPAFTLSKVEGKAGIQSLSGYTTVGSSPSVVTSDKLSFGNIVRLWIQSDYPKQSLFPQINLVTSQPRHFATSQFPHFTMTDEVTYQTPASPNQGGPDGKIHSLFAEPPIYLKPNYTGEPPIKIFDAKSISAWNKTQQQPIQIVNQSSESDMVFKATVEIKKPCSTCVVVLKQTYHPSWKTTVNGKSVTPISVFPYYTAIRLEEPGTYDIIFSYIPSIEKKMLFWGVAFFGICSVLFFVLKNVRSKKR